MHRSGTSAVAGALGAAGLQLFRPDDRMEWAESNPEHWESLSLGLYNEDLLVRLDGGWDAPPDMPLGWEDGPEIRGAPDPSAVLASAYPGAGPSVWKDPRLCLLLPFWKNVLPAPIAAVFVWRSPMAVARSLFRRDQLPITDGLALWERYNRSAVEALDGVDTYVLDYESLLEDPEASLGGVFSWFDTLDQLVGGGSPWDLDAAAKSIARGFHHQGSDRHEEDDSPLLREQRELVDHLSASRGGHRPLVPDLPGAESAWTTAVLRLRRKLSAPNRELDAAVELLRITRHDLEARLEVSQRELVNLQASTSWRITGPMRSAITWIDDLRHGHPRR